MFFHLLSLIRFLCDESFIILFKCNCDNCHRLLIPYMQYWINYGIFLATYQYLSNDLSCQYYGQENTDKDLDSVYPYNAVSSELLRLNIVISVRQMMSIYEFEFWCLTPLSVIFQLYHSWRPVLVVEETKVPGENHWPWASNW